MNANFGDLIFITKSEKFWCMKKRKFIYMKENTCLVYIKVIDEAYEVNKYYMPSTGEYVQISIKFLMSYFYLKQINE